MTRFKPTSVFILKRERPNSQFWTLRKGNKKSLFMGLYLVFQKVYGLMDDKDRITKIEVRVTREK